MSKVKIEDSTFNFLTYEASTLTLLMLVLFCLQVLRHSCYKGTDFAGIIMFNVGQTSLIQRFVNNWKVKKGCHTDSPIWK